MSIVKNATSGGETIDTDAIGGVHAGVSKIRLGAAGADGGLVSTANPMPVGGAAAAGAAISGNPVLNGGSDGTNARALLTDTSGRQVAVGAAATGAAVAGNPVLVGASDGTNAQAVRAGTSTTNGGASVPAVVVRPFVPTDGTNVAPTMDAAARRGYVQVTDGTNSLPTMDAAARKGFVQITDGTNNPAVKAASTAAATADPALVVSFAGANSAAKIGDGTNSAAIKAASTAAATADPALVVSFAGANSATKIGDGTNNVAIKAASTAAAAGDPSAVVQLSPNDPTAAILQAGTKVISTSIARPADTTAYAVNDAISDSTSAPTSGGFSFASAARVSGGGGRITDLFVTSTNNAGTNLQGELWIFDQSVTAINDNAAWNLSDADVQNALAVIPFALITEANNSWAHVQGLNIGFVCSGSANLRFLVKAKNAYTPASAEVLRFRLKLEQTN